MPLCRDCRTAGNSTVLTERTAVRISLHCVNVRVQLADFAVARSEIQASPAFHHAHRREVVPVVALVHVIAVGLRLVRYVLVGVEHIGMVVHRQHIVAVPDYRAGVFQMIFLGQRRIHVVGAVSCHLQGRDIAARQREHARSAEKYRLFRQIRECVLCHCTGTGCGSAYRKLHLVRRAVDVIPAEIDRGLAAVIRLDDCLTVRDCRISDDCRAVRAHLGIGKIGKIQRIVAFAPPVLVLLIGIACKEHPVLRLAAVDCRDGTLFDLLGVTVHVLHKRDRHVVLARNIRLWRR